MPRVKLSTPAKVLLFAIQFYVVVLLVLIFVRFFNVL
jgi:hypothetical protein